MNYSDKVIMECDLYVGNKCGSLQKHLRFTCVNIEPAPKGLRASPLEGQTIRADGQAMMRERYVLGEKPRETE